MPAIERSSTIIPFLKSAGFGRLLVLLTAIGPACQSQETESSQTSGQEQGTTGTTSSKPEGETDEESLRAVSELRTPIARLDETIEALVEGLHPGESRLLDPRGRHRCASQGSGREVIFLGSDQSNSLRGKELTAV